MESLINLLRNINEPFGNDNTYIILINKLQETIQKLKINISDEELNIINKKYNNIKMKTDALISNDNLKNLFDYYQIPNINYFLKNRILVNLIIKFLLLKKKYDAHKNLDNALGNLTNTSNLPPSGPQNPPQNPPKPPPSLASSQSSIPSPNPLNASAPSFVPRPSNPLNASASEFVPRPSNPLNASASEFVPRQSDQLNA
jgi:hypothetical protein